jgi:hypothetical protein
MVLVVRDRHDPLPRPAAAIRGTQQRKTNTASATARPFHDIMHRPRVVGVRRCCSPVLFAGGPMPRRGQGYCRLSDQARRAELARRRRLAVPHAKRAPGGSKRVRCPDLADVVRSNNCPVSPFAALFRSRHLHRGARQRQSSLQAGTHWRASAAKFPSLTQQRFRPRHPPSSPPTPSTVQHCPFRPTSPRHPSKHPSPATRKPWPSSTKSPAS